MQHSICHGPNHATLDFILDEDDEINAEPDSLLMMSPSIEITTPRIPTQNASRWWGTHRNLSAGEIIFTASFRARANGAILSLAPRLPGSILHLATTEMTSYCIAQGSYLASTPAVSITYRYAGFQGVLSRKGLHVMQTAGAGDVYCASYGAIIERELAKEESMVIDNRFVIAFSESIRFQLVRVARDLMGNAFPGGGFANQFTGPGNVIYQTRARPMGGAM